MLESRKSGLRSSMRRMRRAGEFDPRGRELGSYSVRTKLFK
jgi:hypothetical protein